VRPRPRGQGLGDGPAREDDSAGELAGNMR